ncbi:MAG: hypothetical protein HY052_06995 [Proteobacteria bacterium]|nr:hypothetical protein [Pseudomonadota bacterium]
MNLSIKKFLQMLLVVGLIFVAASESFAQKAAEQKTDEKKAPYPVLQKFEAGGGKVDFLGHAYGLDGWIVTNDKGGVRYVYTTPEGAMLMGMLFSPDGTLETTKQIKVYKQRTGAAVAQAAPSGVDKSPSKSEKLYAETEKANWVSFGSSSAPYLYVFINVGCDHCQAFLKDLDDSVKTGKLQVRVIPYGAVETNRDAAAALLSVEHPEESWRAYIASDQTALGKDKIKDGAYAKSDANTALVKQWKLPGPPFTLYRRSADQMVTAIAGRPENTMLVLADFLALGEGKP